MSMLVRDDELYLFNKYGRLNRRLVSALNDRRLPTVDMIDKVAEIQRKINQVRREFRKSIGFD